jgi:hypothetical protein
VLLSIKRLVNLLGSLEERLSPVPTAVVGEGPSVVALRRSPTGTKRRGPKKRSRNKLGIVTDGE